MGAHLRIAVTGLNGQIVTAIIERAPNNVEIIALGRPQLELSHRNAVLASLRHARCELIINAAAYTQVDKAESEPELAMLVNGEGAGHVAEAAAELGLPLVHLSTDYVFDGLLDRPYLEIDIPNPAGAYGLSKLVGEEKIRQIHQNHVILRTAWVYSPFGTNFVKTMLRLGRDRNEIRVVADQLGNPTSALDIADAIMTIATRITTDTAESLRGTFHLTGQGEASWADIAENLFLVARTHGYKPVKVCRITTKEYPTDAKRPENSRLNNDKLLHTFGIKLPEWQISLATCVERLLKDKF